MQVYIGLDTGSLSLGADALVEPLQALASSHGGQLIQTGGRGLYHLEPLVEFDKGNKRHAFARVQPHQISELLVDGQIHTGHSQYVGTIDQLPEMTCQTRVTFARAGLADPLDFKAYTSNGGTEGLARALTMTPQQLVDCIKESGLRGRGGAGFPTGIKWQTVLDAQADHKYVVCNADEGDSGTFADRLLMESDPFTLIEGMVIAGYATGAHQGYVYLRSEYPLALERMQQALAHARTNNILGEAVLDSDFAFDIVLRRGAGAYICGEETSLLESLEGKRGMIRYKPPLPALEGLFGKPTVLNNVISLATVPAIVASGASAYAAIGHERSRGTLTVQLAGNIARGGLYELPFGITLGELVTHIGGGTRNGKPVRAVQVGGPLGAYFPESLFDTPLDYESFAAREGLIGHGGVVVFDDSVDMITQAEFAFRFCAHESCGKCTPCRLGSTRGAELVAQLRDGIGRPQKIKLLTDLCELMEKTSLCALGGMTPYPVKSALKHFPQDFGIIPSQSTDQIY